MKAKLKWIKMLNGYFPACPHCHKLMAKGFAARAYRYVCITGCGYSVETKEYR
jgi:hypothetical protein